MKLRPESARNASVKQPGKLHRRLMP